MKWATQSFRRDGHTVLPSLRGWWLKTYNLVWLAALIAALAMTGIGAWKGFTPMQYGWLNYGLSSTGNSRQIALVLGAEPIAKGISPGDRILAIDGVPIDRVNTDWAAIQARLIKPEGATVALTLQDAGGTVETHRLTSSSVNTAARERARQIEAGAALLIQFALLSAAILLFRRRCEPVPAMLALSFAMMAAIASADATLWLDDLLLQGIFAFGGFGLLLFGLLVFPDGRARTRECSVLGIGLLVWGIAAVLVPTSLAGQIYTFGLGVLLLVVGARQLLRYHRLAPGKERQQVRWAIFGFACGIIFFSISFAATIAAMQLGGARFEPLSFAATVTTLLGIFCMVGGLLVSLMRYRLYDADAVIGRSAAYGVLTLGFIALFAAGEKSIEVWSQSYFGGELGALAGGLAAAGAAVLIVPLHRRVNDWAERRFQKQLLRLRRDLPELVGDLREMASLQRIAEAVLTSAVSGVQATRAAVLVDDQVLATRGVSPEEAHRWMEGRDIAAEANSSAKRDPLFPMRLPLQADAIGRIGWLVLGPRPDGSFYGKDEREALAEIAGPVARAIEIARMRDRRDGDLLGLLQRLEARIEELEGGTRESMCGVQQVLASQ